MRPGRKTLTATAAAVGFALYRRWHQGWGATREEVRGPMPGDALVRRPHFVATRAITIEAAPADVWPWLVQVGFSRAGFYSYDWLDNLGRGSAKEIIDIFQDVDVGDLAAPMATPLTDETAFRVHSLEKERSLVWLKPDASWAWQLTPLPDGGTRLVTRLCIRYDLSGPGTAVVPVLLIELGDFPMMRKMLLGIRERAEALGGGEPESEPAPGEATAG